MERRKTPRKDWVIGKDEVGRAVLEWKLEASRSKGRESDPCARTYDFLNRLEVPDLRLEEEAPSRRSTRSFDPYDHTPAVPHRRYRWED